MGTRYHWYVETNTAKSIMLEEGAGGGGLGQKSQGQHHSVVNDNYMHVLYGDMPTMVWISMYKSYMDNVLYFFYLCMV